MMELFGLVVPFVLLASVVLLLLVLGELAPQGGLTGRGKWLLTAALGTGIAAIAFKLTLIALFISLPRSLVSPLLFTSEATVATRDWLETDDQLNKQGKAKTGYVWQALPQAVPIPPDNPISFEKIALGERLFHDPRLSLNGTVSCSSCHDVRNGAGADGRRTSAGIDEKIGTRNAPTVWNAAFQAVLFWDGRATSLEEQAKGPLTNPVEMGMPSLEMVEERIKQIPEYTSAFAEAFGDDTTISIKRIVQAIATYERTLITPDSPYDRFVRGDRKALSPSQLRGMALFEEVGCMFCHTGPNFSSASTLHTSAPYRLFPALSTPYDNRFNLTGDTGLQPAGSRNGIWRVPSLRNVALTAPYFHNGSVDRLDDAVRIMASAQLGRPLPDDEHAGRTVTWSDKHKTLKSVLRKPLSDEEVSDIVAFLHALSSDQLVDKIANKSERSGRTKAAVHNAMHQ